MWQVFKQVLAYLRDGSIAIPRDPCKTQALLAEARYFQLPELEKLAQSAWKEVPARVWLPLLLAHVCLCCATRGVGTVIVRLTVLVAGSCAHNLFAQWRCSSKHR